jgi:hypothetical protein
LPPPFGLLSQAIQLRHRSQKLVERVGDDLLGRSAADGACESQLEMALWVESQRERRLGLAARGSTGPRRTPRSRLSSANSNWSDVWKGFRLSFWIIGLGSFIQLFVAVVNAQSVRNFRLLRMYRRADRSQAGWMQRRVLVQIFAERVMSLVAWRDGGLGRLEPHVVPAEILEIAADLAEALRPHRRAGSALARQKSGRERSERLGFVHFAAPY